MGCSEVKRDLPMLSLIFEPQNQKQQDYCYKFKESLKPKKSIKFEVKSFINANYTIILYINGQAHIIEDSFDENKMESSIQTVNKLLEEA